MTERVSNWTIGLLRKLLRAARAKREELSLQAYFSWPQPGKGKEAECFLLLHRWGDGFCRERSQTLCLHSRMERKKFAFTIRTKKLCLMS